VGGSFDPSGDDLADVAIQRPEFANLDPDARPTAPTPLNRFYDVNVTVWAELGRVQIPLGELLKLGEGSVMRLERPISAPVDLMAQGVRVARGEVVVVDDCFAIRIKELDVRGKSGPSA
jgi:flagellar motor switch protein FliN/FliY